MKSLQEAHFLRDSTQKKHSNVQTIKKTCLFLLLLYCTFKHTLVMQSASSSQMPASTAAAFKRTGKLYNTYTEAYLAALSKSNGRYYKYLFVVSIAFAVLFQMRFGSYCKIWAICHHLHLLTCTVAAFINLFSWRTLLFSFVLFFTGAVISLIRNITYTGK